MHLSGGLSLAVKAHADFKTRSITGMVGVAVVWELIPKHLYFYVTVQGSLSVTQTTTPEHPKALGLWEMFKWGFSGVFKSKYDAQRFPEVTDKEKLYTRGMDAATLTLLDTSEPFLHSIGAFARGKVRQWSE